MEIRLEDDGVTLDEIVGEGKFHLEKMDNGHWWLGLDDGEKFVHVNLTSPRKITASTDIEDSHDG